jgi:hypothetical protein
LLKLDTLTVVDKMNRFYIVLVTLPLLMAGVVFCVDPLVLTPGGWYPKSCVHHVDDPAAIVDVKDPMKMAILYSNGSVRSIPRCHSDPKPISFQQNGWVAYAVWGASAPVTMYNGYWTVPGIPVQEEAQTLFLFTGLQNAYAGKERQGVSIIQPVLQWGPSEAGGGNYWSIASWWVGANVFYSPLKQVNTGDRLYGTMGYNANKTWSITAHDMNTGTTTTLNVNVGVDELWAFVTLEVYGVATCGDYPNGDTEFTQLIIKNKNKVLTPTWKPQVVQQCNEAVKIVNAQTIDVKF